MLGTLALPVSGFSLLQACIDILRVVEIVSIQGVVLEAGAYEPSTFCSFNQEASASGDILESTTLQRVVSSPTPHVFDVGR